VTVVFTGVGVALVTIFDEDAVVDVAATASLAEQLVDAGVRAVVVAGSTGEAPALSTDERTALIGAVRNALPGQVPVIAGTGAATGRQAADLTVRAGDAGADAVLVLSPHRVPDPRRYYDTIAKAAGDRPILAYHYPAVSSPGIPVELLGDLPIAGIKDSSAEPERLLQELEAFSGPVYVGSATLLTMAGAVGAAGAILALANVDPERSIAAFAGDGGAQRALLRTHLAVKRDFPVGIKTLVAARFGVSSTVRIGQ
jgi:4-hydroxy-tetrahydrodipicolinate synthase